MAASPAPRGRAPAALVHRQSPGSTGTAAGPLEGTSPGGEARAGVAAATAEATMAVSPIGIGRRRGLGRRPGDDDTRGRERRRRNATAAGLAATRATWSTRNSTNAIRTAGSRRREGTAGRAWITLLLSL